jgi:hypothetical protein
LFAFCFFCALIRSFKKWYIKDGLCQILTTAMQVETLLVKVELLLRARLLFILTITAGGAGSLHSKMEKSRG